ncbi:glycosyltransferase family 4 protein [Sphingomonas elodea]|uniref:glycosyltransferase family 4 protein n=1 Tax=Sphingomonas elodea TaxID=179878 RepID=UPI0002631004|nr:glycosyltransferase family 1 protein [Sphingomonas elodea]
MYLLVDLQGMQNGSRFRGIGRYVHALARGLLRNANGHDVRFLLNGALPYADAVMASLADLADADAFMTVNLPSAVASGDPRNGWRAAAAKQLYAQAVRQLAPDVLLVGSLFEGMGDDTVVAIPEEPRSYRVATILYDLIPLLDPDRHLSHQGARSWYAGKIEEACRSDLLLGISHSACEEGRAHLPIAREAIVHIGAAAADDFAREDLGMLRGCDAASALLASHAITRPYVMHTSAFDQRKNFEGLIAAFGRLPREMRAQHQLVLVCRLDDHGRAKLRQAIADAGLQDQDVILTDYVEDGDLRLLYANASLFVFPSFHEGFGLPVLEAMWCGTPVLGSRLSSVPEVVGLPEAQFNPYDADEMAALIARALGEAAFGERLRRHAAEHVRRFSWDMVASRAIAAMESCLARTCLSPSKPARSNVVRTEDLIGEIAEIRCWPGAEDADLLSAAHAIYGITQFRCLGAVSNNEALLMDDGTSLVRSL